MRVDRSGGSRVDAASLRRARGPLGCRRDARDRRDTASPWRADGNGDRRDVARTATAPRLGRRSPVDLGSLRCAGTHRRRRGLAGDSRRDRKRGAVRDARGDHGAATPRDARRRADARQRARVVAQRRSAGDPVATRCTGRRGAGPCPRRDRRRRDPLGRSTGGCGHANRRDDPRRGPRARGPRAARCPTHAAVGDRRSASQRLLAGADRLRRGASRRSKRDGRPRRRRSPRPLHDSPRLPARTACCSRP